MFNTIIQFFSYRNIRLFSYIFIYIVIFSVDKKDSHLNVNVTAVEEFIARNNDLFNIESIEERRACIYDLKAFLVDKLFMKKWPSFKDDLIKSPSRTLDCLGLSIHKV